MVDPVDVSELPEVEPDPWTRFDMWAQRAWDMTQRAIAAAEDQTESDLERIDSRISAATEAAECCAALAYASSPASSRYERDLAAVETSVVITPGRD